MVIVKVIVENNGMKFFHPKRSMANLEILLDAKCPTLFKLVGEKKGKTKGHFQAGMKKNE